MASIFRRSILLFLPLLGIIASCSEDFEVGAPYKPVTIVYGLLNISDTAHYIRIQKAFFDEERGAFNPKDDDSNFHKSLIVILKELDGAGALVSQETLQQVDLRQEGYPKDSGIFFQDISYAYKTKKSVIPGNRYRLVVTNTATAEVDSAETPILNNVFQVDEFYSSYRVSFTAATQNAKFEMTVKAPANAEIAEGILRFRWVDVNGLTGAETLDSVDWTFATAERTGGSTAIKLIVPERSFYSFLQSNIAPAPPNVSRKISKVDMFVWVGTQEIRNYKLINGAQTGLTADQIKPIYTNVKGPNVYGLFSSRTMRSYRSPISDVTLDSLMSNAGTKPLNFNGRSFF